MLGPMNNRIQISEANYSSTYILCEFYSTQYNLIYMFCEIEYVYILDAEFIGL